MRVLLPLLLFLLLAPSVGVSAQGFLSQPRPSFKRTVAVTAFDARISQQEAQNWAMPSIAELLNSVVAGCGHTFVRGKPVDVRTLHSMKWQNDELRVGFSHNGPCEAWIDDRLMFLSGNCRAQFPDYPAEIPVDFSVCNGTCMFTFYWMPFVGKETLVYKQCAPIENLQP